MGLYLNVFLLECVYFPCVCVNHPSSVCTSFLGVCKPFFTACTHVCFFLAGVHSYACFFLIAAYTFQLHVFIFLLSSFCLCRLSWLFLASLFSHPFPTYYYVFYSYPSHLCIVSQISISSFFSFLFPCTTLFTFFRLFHFSFFRIFMYLKKNPFVVQVPLSLQRLLSCSFVVFSPVFPLSIRSSCLSSLSSPLSRLSPLLLVCTPVYLSCVSFSIRHCV